MRKLLLLLLLAIPAYAQGQGNSFATQPSPQGKLKVQVIGGSIMYNGLVVSVPTQTITVPNLNSTYVQFNGTASDYEPDRMGAGRPSHLDRQYQPDGHHLDQ